MVDATLGRAAILLLMPPHAFAFGFAQWTTIAVRVVFIIVIKRIDVAGIGARQRAFFTDGPHGVRCLCVRSPGSPDAPGVRVVP